MPETTEKLLEKYTDILISKGITDKVAEVIVNNAGARGYGMASLTQCVTVKFEDEENPPLNLFVQVHTNNPSHEIMLTELKAFEKEARFFMEYLPAAKQMCKSKGFDELIDFYPKCYFGDESLIVLENLAIDRGYKMLTRGVQHDFNVASVSLRTLAKHHAVSFAMIQESGGEEKFFQQFPNLDHDGFLLPMLVGILVVGFDKSLETRMEVLRKNQVGNGDETLAKMNSLLGKASSMLSSSFKLNKDEENLLVLNHGDYKSNNLMFLKDKETNEILHHMAIDLQLTRYNSPALDVSSYLFSSVVSSVRQSKLQELLNIYRNALNEVSRDLGHPIELSYEDLLMQYRRKFKFGFLVAMTVIGPDIMTLIKATGIDINTIKMEELSSVLSSCLLNWLKNNPGKWKEMAEEIKRLVDEYSKLEI